MNGAALLGPVVRELARPMTGGAAAGLLRSDATVTEYLQPVQHLLDDASVKIGRAHV